MNRLVFVTFCLSLKWIGIILECDFRHESSFFSHRIFHCHQTAVRQPNRVFSRHLILFRKKNIFHWTHLINFTFSGTIILHQHSVELITLPVPSPTSFLSKNSIFSGSFTSYWYSYYTQKINQRKKQQITNYITNSIWLHKIIEKWDFNWEKTKMMHVILPVRTYLQLVLEVLHKWQQPKYPLIHKFSTFFTFFFVISESNHVDTKNKISDTRSLSGWMIAENCCGSM